jgi:hypothetical protein
MRLGKILLEFLILPTSLFFAYSCQTNSKLTTENNALIEYFEAQFNVNLENYDLLCVISENGCINCNSIYVSKLNPITNRENVIFLITTKGSYFDISNFTCIEKENIVYDFNPPKNIDLISKSTLIFLKDGIFDKEIPVNSANLDLIEQTIDNF